MKIWVELECGKWQGVAYKKGDDSFCKLFTPQARRCAGSGRSVEREKRI
jgi:hypothetical protein